MNFEYFVMFENRNKISHLNSMEKNNIYSVCIGNFSNIWILHLYFGQETFCVPKFQTNCGSSFKEVNDDKTVYGKKDFLKLYNKIHFFKYLATFTELQIRSNMIFEDENLSRLLHINSWMFFSLLCSLWNQGRKMMWLKVKFLRQNLQNP